jgi:hypothetical protein
MKSKSAKAKKAPRKPIAPSDGTDMFSTQYSRRASIYRLAFHKFLVERGIAAAVVTEQCTKPGHLTMYLKICALLVLMPIFATAAFAVDEKKRPPQQGGFLTGTPEEQAACAPDSTKFCRDVIPDTFRVLGCLQEHRKSLRKVCLKVLEDHGQ